MVWGGRGPAAVADIAVAVGRLSRMTESIYLPRPELGHRLRMLVEHGLLVGRRRGSAKKVCRGGWRGRWSGGYGSRE